MTTIYKYKLESLDHQSLSLPAGARILSVGNQNDRICLWAVVEPENPNAPVRIIIHGTGHPADDTERCNFIGTVLLYGGDLVLHVFVEREPWQL